MGTVGWRSPSTLKAETKIPLKTSLSVSPETIRRSQPQCAGRPSGKRAAIFGLLMLGLGCCQKVDALGIETLAMFGDPLQAAGFPIAAPIRGAGGTYLGLASASGAGAGQPLFQINADGTSFRVLRRIDGGNWLSAGASNRIYVTTATTLWSFDNAGNDPRLLHTFETNQPAGGLNASFGAVDDGAGWLYGMTTQGGSSNQGVVYRIHPDGTGFSVIHSFAGFPYGTPGRLRMDRLGRLYGFQDQGILNLGFGQPLMGKSSMFVLSADGTLTRLADWELSVADVVEGRDDAFHVLAGPHFFSSISPAQFFRIPTGGGAAEVEFTLPSVVGGVADPNPGLGVDDSGRIVGTAQRSLSSTPTPDFEGGVFRFDPATKSYSVRFQFPFSQTDPVQRPSYGPALIDGSWVGFTSGFFGGGLYRLSPEGTNYSVLHAFSTTGGGFTPGDTPLIHSDGSVILGGTHAVDAGYQIVSWRPGDSGLNTLLQVTNTSEVLSGNAPPFGHLTRVADGTIYHIGTISTASSSSIAVSKLSSDGTQAIRIANRAKLYSADGKLWQSANGSIYGVSIYGGTADNGALFRVTSDAGIQLLFSFGVDGGSGKNPQGGVVEASDGLLYGITDSPKTNNGGPSFFRIRKDGTHFEELGSAGTYVNAGLSPASDGNLYALVQGVLPQLPTAIIRVAIPSGAVSQVTKLPLSAGAQAYVSGSVTEGVDGRLYVITSGDGASDRGTIFSVERNGTDGRTEHQFTTAEVGSPSGSLSVGIDGWLYGFTRLGGTANAGGLFRIPALPRLSVDRNGSTGVLKTRLRVGARARFESAPAPTGPWTTQGTTVAADSSGDLSTQITPTASQQFYRLVLE